MGRCAETAPLQRLAGKTDAAFLDVQLDPICQASLIQRAGQPEVGDLDRALLRDQDVGRLEVAMAAQALAVGIFHAITALDRPAQALGQVGWPALSGSLSSELRPSAFGAMYSVTI